MRLIALSKRNLHLLLLFLGVVVGLLLIGLVVHNEDAEMRQQLLAQARSIDLALGWSSMYDEVQTDERAINASPLEANSAEDALSKTRARLSGICAVYPNCRAVYLMRQNPKQQIYFLVDSSAKDSDLYIVPGTVYKEANKAVYQVFSGGEMAVDGPETDRWGVWMSAFVPHTLPDKSQIVVGIDVEAKDWNHALWKAATVPILATLAFIALMLSYISQWRKKNQQNQIFTATEQRLLKLSLEDSLTGLPNRRYFDDRLEQMIAEAARTSIPFTVIYLDLDKFKQINDTFGHLVGDELLCSVAKRLQSVLRAEDTVARLAGDEFAMLLPRIGEHSEAELVAQKILQAIAAPLTLQNHDVIVTASVGVTIYSDNNASSYQLLHAADEALYNAKNNGKNRYSFQ